MDAPPPAPSPPAAAYPVNVFDFLVNEQSPTAAKGASQLSSTSVQYGAGPVERTFERYDSGVNHETQDSGLGYSTTLRTPGASHSQVSNGGDKTSEKKRKRTQADDLSIVPPQARSLDQPGLHSGLTGGLNRLLSNQDPREYEASPLSPKKRSKHQKEEKAPKKRKDDDVRHSKHADDEDRHNKKHRQVQDEVGSRAGREIQAIEGSREMKQIEYPQAKRQADESNSEFFLSLINRDHLSSKGQSIWGALKMFRDGLPGDLSNKETKEYEEKRLFRGLRMRINNAGEIVLFSRPELEISGSAGMEVQKR